MQTAGQLFPTTLVFAGFSPFPASRHSSAFTQTLRLGGESPSAPTIFFALRTDLPAGLLAAITPKRTTFAEGTTIFLGRVFKLSLFASC